MANVNVTYDQLNSVASRLTSGQADIESKLGELKNLVDSLISEGFVTDRASGAFGNSYEQFTAGARQTISGLEGLSKFLNQTAAAFTDTDSQLSAALKG